MIVYFCSVCLYVQVCVSLCKVVFSVCVGRVVCRCLVGGLVLLMCLFCKAAVMLATVVCIYDEERQYVFSCLYCRVVC